MAQKVVTEKVIGGKVFLNFCGELILPMESITKIEKKFLQMTSDLHKKVFGHHVTIFFSAGGKQDSFTFLLEEYAQAVIDWMEGPTTSELQSKIDALNEEIWLLRSERDKLQNEVILSSLS